MDKEGYPTKPFEYLSDLWSYLYPELGSYMSVVKSGKYPDHVKKTKDKYLELNEQYKRKVQEYANNNQNEIESWKQLPQGDLKIKLDNMEKQVNACIKHQESLTVKLAEYTQYVKALQFNFDEIASEAVNISNILDKKKKKRSLE